MNRFRLLIVLVLASVAGLLGGCSAGNSGDASSSTGVAIPLGLDRFLLFPNPVVLSGTTFQTNTNAFAQAYYAAIDPASQKDTLAKWKAANGFGNSGTGEEFMAVFRDVRDLGYGRRMFGRRNFDGTIAFYVENYNVSAVPGGYSTVNVDAAVLPDGNWHVGTNAIEWSPATCTSADPSGTSPVPCNSARKFAKYFNFNPKTGARQTMLDLDQRGLKAMPGICVNCHGGRGDPLTPTGKYGLVENLDSRKRGDVGGKLQAFNVGSFEWSTTPGFTRADQEAVLKLFNQWVLCSYPGSSSYNWTRSAGPQSCTQQAEPGGHEWDATEAKAMINAWYAGDINTGTKFSDTYLPAGWSGNTALYQQVVVPYCRTCHVLRGTADENTIDFTTKAKFDAYKDRIKTHVFDRGNMPLAFLVYQDFWRSTAPDTLAAYIDSVTFAGNATQASGKAKQPGRPIADPGPDRMAKPGTNAKLSSTDSLFATSASWQIVTNPGGSGTLTAGPTPDHVFFSAAADGVYEVRLTVSNGSQSDSKSVFVTVDSASNFPNPANIKFAHVLDVLRNKPAGVSANCTSSGCHSDTPTPYAPPIIYVANVDRDGDGAAGTATDEDWLLAELRGRANLTEVSASPLLRKPMGDHHKGSNPIDLAGGGMPALASFSKLYWWIANGAPAGGVAANAGANTTNTVTFSGPLGGPYTSPAITLDGSASVGTSGTVLSYLWSVSPANGTSIASSTSATTTFTVQNVGTYVAQLQVSGGADTDTATRTITVQETPITAAFSPGTGSTALNFSGSPATSNIVLHSTSTGSPVGCKWDVTGPSGFKLDGTSDVAGAASVTKSCGTDATLNVPFTAVGGIYDVTLTASTIGSSNVTHSITVANGTPVTASITHGSSTGKTFSGGNSGTTTPGTATVALDGTGSSGVPPLSYAWSITSQPDSTNGPASLSCTTGTGCSTPNLTVRATGSYTVQLTVTDAALNSSSPATSTFTVTSASGYTFSSVKGVLSGCTGCHVTAGANSSEPDWNDENAGGLTLWQRVFQRTNLGSPSSSRLVDCPTNGCGAMSAQPGLFSGTDHTNFVNWITDGAPPGN
jgi:PKD repeat protein